MRIGWLDLLDSFLLKLLVVMQSHGVLAALASGNMHPRVAYLSGRFKVVHLVLLFLF